MPLFFGSIGLLLIIAGLRDRVVNGNPSLVSLLENDFNLSSSGSFTLWMFAIVFIGAIGYIPKLRTVSRMFLVLVVVVIFVKNNQLENVFGQLSSFFGGNPQALGTLPTNATSAQLGTPQVQQTPLPTTIPEESTNILQNLPTFPIGS